jgi:hypothetical protein
MVFGRRQQGGVPHAQLTGVQKAPRHEVAASLAPAEQRALWGFNAGAELDDRCESGFCMTVCYLEALARSGGRTIPFSDHPIVAG